MVSIINWFAKQFGSDVYTHYTAVYTWNSNQMAHAMMGFAGTTLFIHAAQKLGYQVWLGALFSLIPFLKDVTDSCSDIFIVKPEVFKMQKFHKCESIRDGITDNIFWNTGSIFAFFVAISCTEPPWIVCISFIILLLFVALCAFGLKPYYNKQKRLFDVSGLPYYFRLPLFRGNVVAASNIEPSLKYPIDPINGIERFVYMDKDRARHLLLFGPPRSLKTTLAAAIGSGLTIRHQTVRYLSGVRLIEEFVPDDDHGDRSSTEPIPPDMADIVIVDDLDQPTGLEQIFPALIRKSTVWVVTDRGVQNQLRKWVEILGNGLGGRLVSIELEKPGYMTEKQVSPWVRILAAITLLVSFVGVVGAVGILLLVPQKCELLSFCCTDFGRCQGL